MNQLMMYKILMALLEMILAVILQALTMGMVVTDFVGRLINRVNAKITMQKSVNEQPSLIQWANRLIEFVDDREIVDSAKRFIALVDNGVDPAFAFRMVTR